MSKGLGEIYSAVLPCHGFRPESDASTQTACDLDAKVVQRGAFQLRLPEVVTSLTIPPLVNRIHTTLQREDVQNYVSILKDVGLTKETFLRGLGRQLAEKRMPSEVVTELTKTPWEEIEEAISEIETVSSPRTQSEYLEQEHTALTRVVTTGFPPYPSAEERRPGEPVSFQVNLGSIIRNIRTASGKVFRVMPIERLRVVIVQTGFRRVVYSGADVQPPTSSSGTHPATPQISWMPGVEQFGEGVFIDLNPDIEGQHGWYPAGPHSREWDAVLPLDFAQEDLIRWNALSVWWHTFSHRLINAISLHSGYSSSAIRERLYLSVNEDGTYVGGVLLYTTQPGGDGTMGGLTSLVPSFDRIFELSMTGIDRCSNDPLCENSPVDPVSKLGAACYSCEMVSETSCEHYNGNLNRRILLENPL